MAAEDPALAQWREERAAREELNIQRREQRERIRQLREELRQDARGGDSGGGAERGGGFRRMSPEERVRFREDIREAWRERRSRR